MDSSFAFPDAVFPQDLPKYTYVPGITPHPVSDPAGHAHGSPRPAATGSLAPGMCLFHHGFYWEAHEAWEAEWLAAGRTGPHGDMIKGFIKLAACGVKCLEGNAAGAKRHARRAQELLQRSLQHPELPVAVSVLQAAMQLAQSMANVPRLATPGQQEQTKKGGVPLLGRLP